MDRIYAKYKRLGLVTLFPLSIVGYFAFYAFSSFYYQLFVFSSFPEDFSWKTDRGIENIIGILFFTFLFSVILSATVSSVCYGIAGYKKDEKWLRRGHNSRVYPWLFLILSGLGFVGLISGQILFRF